MSIKNEIESELRHLAQNNAPLNYQVSAGFRIICDAIDVLSARIDALEDRHDSI